MKRLGPLLTLGAVAGLAAVLLVVNMSKETEPTQAKPNSVTTTQAPPATGAPTATPFPAKADYVGTIPLQAGGAITLSIAVQGSKATAYACDGNTIESWLQGSAANGSLQLTGKNDARLDGSFDGKAVHGTLWLGGQQWGFTAAPVQPPAGLYVYNDGGQRESWIVDANGGVTGVRRAADGSTAPAPALTADATAIVNGKKITASKVSGGDSVG
ncbi:hypothetical protein [Nocardia sp. NBC_01009]|uniref:hypothetical protein n=1 Tax=Nocardia sp. NBC_01009 TaxID=2975996 RepID=UPI0038645528|nr:hypothetical protein OHA42_15915 [Nocardia sp. NBC_01009]